MSKIIDSLIENRYCFLQVSDDLVEMAKTAFKAADDFLRSNETNIALDEKTMFPTSLENNKFTNRKVIQVYDYQREFDDNAKIEKIKQDMRDLCESMSYIAATTIAYICAYKNIPHESSKDLLNRNEWVLNTVHYPFEPGNKGAVLFPAHKDWGTLAIYPFIQGEGLEINPDGKEWIPVKVPEGHMFCYGGDILQRVTGVPALLHRVIQPTDEPTGRTSMIFYADTHRGMVLPDGRVVGDIMDEKLRKIGQIK